MPALPWHLPDRPAAWQTPRRQALRSHPPQACLRLGMEGAFPACRNWLQHHRRNAPERLTSAAIWPLWQVNRQRVRSWLRDNKHAGLPVTLPPNDDIEE